MDGCQQLQGPFWEPPNDEYNTLGYVRETPIFMESTDQGWIRAD